MLHVSPPETIDAQAAEAFLPAPRVVRPRSRTYRRLPVMAIMDNKVLDEDGQVIIVDQLVRTLRKRAPTLFVKLAAADFVGQLDEQFSRHYPSTWQWRAAANERDIMRPDGVRAATRVTTIIHYFGFKDDNYHKIIDPIGMYGLKLDEVWPGDEPKHTRLLKWGIAIRDFCDENGMEVRPTIGAIASQFLTDRRFYPEARRKVPHQTNRTVREQLPGNFYSLTVYPSPNREYTAHYLDQHGAHHYSARTSNLPHADHLYAFGRFTDLAEPVFRNVWDEFYGLYCLDLQVPAIRRNHRWTRQYLHHRSVGPNILEKRYVYSNELPYLQDMGYSVVGVRAAWGSRKRDTGLSKYAQWAEEQLDRYGEARWIKTLLLSTYGTLATRPKIQESIFKQAKTGESVLLHVGQHELKGLLTKGRVKLEPRIANVLHRGMIEAACRIESIAFAQYLESKGHRILSIYADAVVVEVDDDRELPQLLEPWRLKRTLHHLRFINQQAFISGEMTKLPGISREDLPYRRPSPGRAPRKIKKYNALSGQPIYLDWQKG